MEQTLDCGPFALASLSGNASNAQITEEHASRLLIPFETRLADFMKQLGEFIENHRKATCATLPTITITASPGGKKFIRIVRCENGKPQSVYCFVGVADGGIYKPDGWKRPAPSARGNIYNANPLAGCGPYGVAYLR